MNILVCGGAGFIGSSFARLVLSKHPEDKVVVYDALTYAGHLSTIEDLETDEKFRFHQGRIEDSGAISRVIKDEEIDTIVNFAAETHNDRSLLDQGGFLQTNVIGVSVLLEMTREHGIQKYVQVSTDEVYGTIDEGHFTETSPLEPNTPYSASKAAGDLLCRAHFVSYKTPVIVTRGGNSYGPYHYPEKLIPFFISRLMDDKKVPVYGEGDQIREWIHVADHASGINVALRNGQSGEVYNVADSNERTNMAVVRIMLEELGKSEELVKFIPDPRKGAHDKRYSMAADKLKRLGWSPTVPFETGIRETIQWFVQHERWWRPIVKDLGYQEFIRKFYGPGLGEDL